ncbi:OmpA family protein [Chachezhania sediminis]|uniref:OmpA family protein n=1 Tax=Chachezhania sediminis TaxID=2599291 RepID=UPI00131DFE5F|nr:OmpA family protein [Chachezhania sediminis]
MTRQVSGARRRFRTLPFIVPALAGALALSACTDPAKLGTDLAPGNAHQNRNNAAVAGGIVGGGLGAIFGGSTTAAVAGAAVGAMAGAAIGDELDKQAAQLRNQLTSQGVTVRQDGQRVIVTLPQDITFATNSFAVKDSLKPDLARLAQSMNAYPNSTAQVIGHTDNTGDATYNIGLSQQRAEAVSNILIIDGVAASRLRTVAAGESSPIASNLTEEGRAQNRRVEVVITQNN